jgi:lipopolysaccharide export system protein LptA
MMIFRFEPKRISFRVLAAMLLLCLSFWHLPSAGASAVAETGRDAERKSPVTVTADELVGDENSKSAEFIGNVKVIRGTYTLTTDRLKVFFDSIEKPTREKSAPRANIREIIAEGRVRISSPELSAGADRATYDRKTRTIVLTGENTVVNHNGSRIKGGQIIIFMDTEEVQVSGNSRNRVKGVFNIPQKN